MKQSKILMLAGAVAASALATAPAAAVNVYSTDFSAGAGPEWTSTASTNGGLAGIYGDFDGGVATLTLPVSITGASIVTFDLLPFRTIDGLGNCCTDQFTASYNGVALFSGFFSTPTGGGIDFFIVPPGGSVTPIANSGHTISLAFNAVAGISTFAFTYGALQGYGDEAWGLDNVSVDSTLAAGVPEPASWAMMIAGFGLAGAAMRRRALAIRFA